MDQVVQDSFIILIVQSEVFISDQGGGKWFRKIRRAEFSKSIKKVAECVKLRTAVIGE